MTKRKRKEVVGAEASGKEDGGVSAADAQNTKDDADVTPNEGNNNTNSKKAVGRDASENPFISMAATADVDMSDAEGEDSNKTKTTTGNGTTAENGGGGGVKIDLDQHILDRIVEFEDLSKTKEDKIRAKCRECVRELLSYVVRHQTMAEDQAINHQQSSETKDGGSGSNGLLSPSRVALLLLPWSIKGVLANSGKKTPKHDKSQSLIWNVLLETLRYLSVRQEVDDSVKQSANKILTHSTLLKLVPQAAIRGVADKPPPKSDRSDNEDPDSSSDSSKEDENEDDEDDAMTSYSEYFESSSDPECIKPEGVGIQVAAALSYEILVRHFFQPSIEVVCKNLLIPIVTVMDLKSLEVDETRGRDQNERNVLMATLRLMQTLHQSRKSNPKTTFQVFASRSVLLAISRVYFYFREKPSSQMIFTDQGFYDSANLEQALIDDILYDVFFSADYHIEGFRTWLLTSNPLDEELNLTSSAPVEEVGTMDVDGEEENEKDKESSPADGNRGKKSKKNMCYQELLAKTLVDALLSNDELKSENDSVESLKTYDTRDLCWMLPNLMRGFFVNVKKWCHQNYVLSRDENNSGGSSRNKKLKQRSKEDEVAHLQFLMFVTFTKPLKQLAFTLFDSTRHSMAAVALNSLQRCIGLVLDYDAYSPTQDDENQSKFKFLMNITGEVLRGAGSANSKDTSIAVLSVSTSTLRLLAILDHRLLHDRLVDLMLFCLQVDDPRLYGDIISLFATFIDIYRKLRQQDHIFKCIMQLLIENSKALRRKSLENLALHLKHEYVQRNFAAAVRTSPIVQARNFFKDIRDFLMTLNLEAASDEEIFVLEQCMKIVVRLASICIRNMRVDDASAVDVAPVCKMMMDGPVMKFIDCMNERNRIVILRASLKLCGWLVALHARCIFWLGRKRKIILPAKINKLLLNASIEIGKVDDETIAHPTKYDDIMDELLFLSCNRLRLISTELNEELITNTEEDSEEEDLKMKSKIEPLAFEARQLVQFSVHAAMRQRLPTVCVKKSRWMTIAHNFAAWESHAEERDIDRFLNWMISVLTVDWIWPVLPRSSMAFRKEYYYGIMDEVECAEALLSDATFFESSQVASRFALAALSMASEWISWAILDTTTSDEDFNAELRRRALPVCGTQPWQAWTVEELLKLANSHDDSAVKRLSNEGTILGPILTERLKRADIAVKLATGHLRQVKYLEDGSKFIDSAIRVESVCRYLAASNVDPFSHAARKLTGSIRGALSSAIKISTLDASVVDSAQLLVSVFSWTLDSLSDCVELKESNGTEQLLTGTAPLISQLLHQSIQTVEGRKVISDFINPTLISKGSRGRRLVIARLGRAVLGPIMSPDILSGADGQNMVVILHDRLWKICLEQWFDDVVNPEKVNLVAADAELVRLAGDLVLFSTNWKFGYWSDVLEQRTFVNACIDKLASQELGDELSSSLSYLIGCVIEVTPAIIIAKHIMEKMLVAKRSDPVLDAAFCRLLDNTTGDSIKNILTSVLEKTDKPEAIIWNVRCIGMLFRNIKQEEHIGLLAEKGLELFSLVVSQLHADGASEMSITLTCSVLKDIIRRRDIIVLRERDLAKLLADLSAVAGATGETVDEGGLKEMSNGVFCACAELFALAYQRYTKAFHTCAPSVASFMHALLGRILYEHDIEENEITERGQRFTRICELLLGHKEVYKKHLVGLIIEFVQALQEKRDDDEDETMYFRKQSLLPGMYFLLDAMSTHEMKQLNSSFDVGSKATFKFIYDTYQKLHAYKGQ